jgi:thiol-disulfide isomerase/thioredoxin
MAGLTGKPTVVNIWGSWCIPCQKEEKYFASAYSRLKGKVRFLGVDSVDSADSALDFLAHVRPAVHFPSVFDADRKILLGVGRAGPPVTVFLDRSGKIVGKSSDYTSLNDLYADIANYLHVTA